mgnify:CR=1 FL=1
MRVPRRLSVRWSKAREHGISHLNGQQGDVLYARKGELTPEEREALAAIHEQLTKWNRYVITRRPADADLFIAIRKGRRASSTAAHTTSAM